MLSQTSLLSLRKSLSDPSIERQAELFACIGDATCLKILSLLSSHSELCVTDLTKILGISMPAVSHQLKKLRSLGLVERKRDGQMMCYSLLRSALSQKVKEFLT